MNFFQKLGKVLVNKMQYTIVFAVSFIFFLYFAGGDIIGGVLTALSALVAYISASLIWQEFKKMPKTSGKPVAKKTTKKRK